MSRNRERQSDIHLYHFYSIFEAKKVHKSVHGISGRVPTDQISNDQQYVCCVIYDYGDYGVLSALTMGTMGIPEGTCVSYKRHRHSFVKGRCICV